MTTDRTEPDLYLTDCCFGDSGTPGVDGDCTWGVDEDGEESQ